VRMPDQQLSDVEFEGIVGYVKECTAKGMCKLALGKVKHASEATPPDVDRGRDLFEGRVPLKNGGPACISCHSVAGVGLLGGGTLAKDLTQGYARLTDSGVNAALANTPFPLMKELFPKRPLVDAEIFAIKAFLASASKSGAQPESDHDFFYVGALGLGVMLGGIGGIWRGRLRGVRERVVRQATDKSRRHDA